MNAADEGASWFLRIATDVMKSSFIMDNASAADWRVLMALAKHQGWRKGPGYRKTFPLYIAKTAEEARCSRRQVLRSVDWWAKVGAIKITKRRRVNIYEIVDRFQVPPDISANQRHNTPRIKKRDDQGRIVPSAVTGKVPTSGTIMVPTSGTPNQKSSSEVFSENPTPPPTGVSGLSSETPERPSLPSRQTVLNLIKIKGKDGTAAYLREHGYPGIETFIEGEAL